MTNEEAVAELRRAGTAGKYVGLYAVAKKMTPPSRTTTELFDFDFPSVAPVEELTEAMATVDRRFDGMKAVRTAGWATPRDHPDISPAHEALQMMELFVEIGRTDDAKSRPEDFRRYLSEAERASRSLEEVLRGPHPDVARAEQEFVALKQSCNACHADFRN